MVLTELTILAKNSSIALLLDYPKTRFALLYSLRYRIFLDRTGDRIHANA
jgi:hypothetical protein